MKKAVMIEGPIGPLLIRLTVPMALALLGRVMFNLADTFFVGKLGTVELAAMGFTFPVVMFITSIALGLGVGASATVSKAIGTRDSAAIKRLTTDALTLSFLIVLVLTIIGLVTIRPLFRLLGAEESTLPRIVEYMQMWYIGVPFVVIPMVGNNAIRATGDTKTPMFIMLTSVVINIGLDPLLIFGIGPFPRMELEGAALATVIARAFSFAMSLYILGKREKMITGFSVPIRRIAASWGRIAYIGLPAALTNMIVPLSMGFITRLVSGYGTAAVAGLGVATRVEMFVMMVIGANASVLLPFVGQNWGAGEFGRMKRGIGMCLRFSIIWSALMFVVFLLGARQIARVFNTDPQVVETVRLYMVIVSISYGFFGIQRQACAALNALNRPLQSAMVSVLRMTVFYVPLAYAGAAIAGLQGIFGGAAVANFAAGILAWVWLTFERKKAEAVAAAGSEQHIIPQESRRNR